MKEEINERIITRFIDFCNRECLLFAARSELKDGRCRPQIPTSTIFLSLLMLVTFKMRSLLKLDQLMRMPEVKNFFKSDRKMVVSDTTIARVLPTFHKEPLRGYMKVLYLKARKEGLCKVMVEGQQMRVAVVDGSAFQVVGEADLFLDVQPAENVGKELVASREVIDRVFDRYGDGFVDYILLDGLYVDRRTINQILSHGSCPVIRREETTLKVIRDAEGLFKKYEMFQDVEHREGFDDDRLCQYEVWACGGFHMDGVDHPVKVAHVKENYPKRKKGAEEDFWVVSFDEKLSGMQMRELAHVRWKGENNGFRQLNQQSNCDHVYMHDRNGFEALLLILFIGWALLQLFNLIRRPYLWPIYRGVKWTYDFVVFQLLISFFQVYGGEGG